jgi:hypothetical protein
MKRLSTSIKQLKANATTIEQQRKKARTFAQKALTADERFSGTWIIQLLTGNQKERCIAAQKISYLIHTSPSTPKKQFAKAFTKPLLEALKDSSYEVRSFAIQALGGIRSKIAIDAIKHSIFDSNRFVREQAILKLAPMIGYLEIAKLLNKKYPRNYFRSVPLEFMTDGERLSFSTQTQETRKDSHKNRYNYIRTVYGNPDFWHRGLPVYLVNGLKSYGRYTDGVILLAKNKRQLKPEFRKIVAEHEFGEMFSHEIGLVMELIYAKKEGIIQEYLKHPKLGEELKQMITQHPQEFRQFKQYL